MAIAPDHTHQDRSRTPDPPPVMAFYIRISTDEDHQRYSLEAQQDNLRSWCQSNYGDNWLLYGVELNVFHKERITATFRLPLPRPPKRTTSQAAADGERRRPEVLIRGEYSVRDNLGESQQTLQVLLGWRGDPVHHPVGTVVRRLDQTPPLASFLDQCRMRHRKRWSFGGPSVSDHKTARGERP